MSILVRWGDETLWWSTLRSGLLWVRVAEAIGAQLGLEPGLPFESDEVDIELDRFRPFVAELFADYSRSDHAVWRALLAPVLGPGVVLLDRIGQPLEPASDAEAAVLAWARETFGNIPS